MFLIFCFSCSLCTSFFSDFSSLRTSNQVLAKKWLIKSSCFNYWSCSTVKTRESAISWRLCCIGYTESSWDSEPSSESKSITFSSSKSHQQTLLSLSYLPTGSPLPNTRPYCNERHTHTPVMQFWWCVCIRHPSTKTSLSKHLLFQQKLFVHYIAQGNTVWHFLAFFKSSEVVNGKHFHRNCIGHIQWWDSVLNVLWRCNANYKYSLSHQWDRILTIYLCLLIFTWMREKVLVIPPFKKFLLHYLHKPLLIITAIL